MPEAYLFLATMDNTFEAPQGRLLPTLVAFVFVLGLLYTLFLVFEQYSLNRSIASLQADEAKVQGQMEVLNSQQVAEIYVAQQVKDKLEASVLRWSGVITNLQHLTPVGVFLSSYGISEDGGIQLSGVGDGFGSVADMIAALNGSTDFVDVFVPSVTQGSTSDGQTVATFSLTAHTVKP